jgi:glutathione synthase/RimK-type ligase-like ATP-grasp enzyme
MKNILIITSSYDMTIDYFIDKFRNKANFFRFNTDQIYNYKIQITEDTGWIIVCNQWNLKQNDTEAIYFRKPSFPDISEYEYKYHNMIRKDILTFIQGIAESFKGKCLTRPSILYKAENKIYQLSIAKEIGFQIPRSLITNSSNAAFDFCNSTQCIIKPLSVGKIYTDNKVSIIQTNLVDNSFEFNGLEASPSYFQEFVSKDYEVRVTIIDNKVFAVKIESSEKVDWRKHGSSNSYSKMYLPDDLQLKCLSILKKLNLDFGAFDFIVNKGNYYFLEVNPNGQWYWLEESLDLSISDNIFNYLVEDK